MKKILTAAIVVIIFFSCKKSKNSGDEVPDCSRMGCPSFLIFDFKLVDKTTGADLVFGSNPRYATGDIKLFVDANRTVPLLLQTDSTNRFFNTYPREEMYLEIKGTDVYKLTATRFWATCCGSRVKELRQDGKLICSSCADVIELAVN